jgi:hypothetical protein
MATGSIVVNVLDVGQGQGTFVEIYSTGGTLTNTLLFDLGSAKGSTTAGLPSINYIADKVALMATPKIDYMSLSHKDRDHVNLLVKLITAINLKIAPKELEIGMVRYGGVKEWYSNNLIKELEKICPDVDSLSLRHTCYKPPSTWTPIWLKNDVYVYILLANIPTDDVDVGAMDELGDDKPDSELANSVSIISSIWWNNNQFFINGDATFVTFQESNKIFKLVPNFQEPKMVTLPHHGSRKTTFGLSSSTEDASKEATAVVETFAKKISAKTVTSSAEIFGSYHHPSYDVMTSFNKFADQVTNWYSDPNLDKNRHYVTAYLDNTMTNSKKATLSGVYSSFETTMNVYSTLYCVPDYVGGYLAPPTNPVGSGTKFKKPQPVFSLGVQWGYTVNSAGKVTLAPKTNRAATLFNVAEVLRALGPPGKWVKNISPDDNGGTPVKAAIPAKSPVLRGLKSFR